MFYDDRWPRRRLVDLMVRIKRANGTWDDLAEAKPAPEPFERADGTRMTSDDVTRMGKAAAGYESFSINPPTPATLPKTRSELAAERAAQAWAAVERLGTQRAAEQELGITRGRLIALLDRYMNKHDIKGPRPGLLPEGTKRAKPSPRPQPATKPTSSPMNGVGHRFAAVYEPLEREARADAEADRIPPAPPPFKANGADHTLPTDWWEDARRRYFDVLLERAKTSTTDWPILDRIERLLGRAA